MSSISLAVAVFLAALHGSLIAAQAPGDGDPECPADRAYGEGITPLMDTTDYKQLILYGTTNTRWQEINEDDDDENQWLTSALSCSSEFHVYGCGASLPQNNWLITQHINTTQMKEFNSALPTLRVMIESSRFSDPCPGCSNALSLYVWRTSMIDSVAATDTSRYQFAANFSSPSSATETQHLTINLPSVVESGFYLGIRDNGSCVTITRLLVYYTVCESSTVGLVRVNGTLFSSASDAAVQGVCVDNSESASDSRPLLRCTETGEWSVLSGCSCSEEYLIDGAGRQCLYPPSAPLNVIVYDVTNSSSSLSWLPPASGSTHPSAGLYYSITYGVPSYPALLMHTTTNATHVYLTGLTPYLPYTFYVTAENAVTSHLHNVSNRTVNVSAFTNEGVGGKVVYIRVDMETQPPITWSEPDPPQGEILRYDFRMRVVGSGRELKDTVYHRAISRETVVRFSTGRLTVEIQAVTIIGGGNYSDPVFFNVTGQDDATTSDSSMPLEVLISIAAIIAVVILLIVVAILLIKCLKRYSKIRVEPTQAPKANNIEEYASIKLSPTDSTFIGISPPPPPVPRSPRPPVPGQDGCIQNADACPVYQVLDGPTPTTTEEGNPYSLEPMRGEMFGVASIDEKPTRGKSKAVDVSTDGGPVYHELENPKNSLLMKRRVDQTPPAHPVKLEVTNTAYWNEGLGPPAKSSGVAAGRNSSANAKSSQPRFKLV